MKRREEWVREARVGFVEPTQEEKDRAVEEGNLNTHPGYKGPKISDSARTISG